MHVKKKHKKLSKERVDDSSDPSEKKYCPMRSHGYPTRFQSSQLFSESTSTIHVPDGYQDQIDDSQARQVGGGRMEAAKMLVKLSPAILRNTKDGGIELELRMLQFFFCLLD